MYLFDGILVGSHITMWFPSVILSLWMALNRNLSPTLRPTFLRIWDAPMLS